MSCWRIDLKALPSQEVVMRSDGDGDDVAAGHGFGNGCPRLPSLKLYCSWSKVWSKWPAGSSNTTPWSQFTTTTIISLLSSQTLLPKHTIPHFRFPSFLHTKRLDSTLPAGHDELADSTCSCHSQPFRI